MLSSLVKVKMKIRTVKQQFLPSELPVSSFLLAVCSRYEGLACSFWRTAEAQSHSCRSSPEKDKYVLLYVCM